ncbi:hypothetical protein E1295_31225 [Nonomuraea mesophila]|uniref:Uncharacterized protein n=1 Tax=Nonomuraea mesophila TaxID=2530382 RepID=A0A4R5EZX7_9ACTN|nr:hypothetical protein [Nonomuraea mesophila]TDE40633.1 hypothetical protein E1295_31225 [Nonomuraea mesophila]
MTAGVTWWAATPSTADSCANTKPVVLSPDSALSFCHEQSRVNVNDGGSGGSRMVAEESGKLAMATGRLARQLGLTGLAAGRSALGGTDIGGVAATWGMPMLTSASPVVFPAVPGRSGMRDMSTLSSVPALPSLPSLPETPLLAKLPAEMSLGQSTHSNRIAGKDVRAPKDLDKPVREVGEDVIGVLLPKAVESVEGTSMLTGGRSAVPGVTGLTDGLGLR